MATSAIFLFALSGCGAGGRGEAYEHVVPEGQSTAITRNGDELTIDASGGRVLFPMQEQTRDFASRAEMLEAIAAKFGNVERILDKNGALEGIRGRYSKIGVPRFENRELGVQYAITEPVLADIAGARGIVKIAGEEFCLDPDGDCSTTYASYLEPIGEPTAPNYVDRCGLNNVCVRFQSFYFRTWFPFPYARHGSNVQFIREHAIAATTTGTSGSIWYRTGLPFPEFDQLPMPTITAHGQDLTETAVWCIGTTSCVEYQTEAVCGFGSITDPDLTSSRRTGNGSLNTTFCPS